MFKIKPLSLVEYVKKIMKYPGVTAVFIGGIVFIGLYGLGTLDITNDTWIYNGYIERDIVQHYAGWLFYRESPWTFPLGVAANLFYPAGTAITFTDSIPIVAIIAKAGSAILPHDFQYFGVWVLLCCILQAFFATKLLSLYTTNRWVLALGSLIFTFSPILHERAFRHSALAAHFLILAALYFYFSNYRRKHSEISRWYIVLIPAAVAIHPYFVPMVGVIFIADMLTSLRYSPHKLRQLVVGAATIVATGLSAFVVGVFEGGGSNSGWGYGFYSLNINSIINPTSMSIESWSAFMPVLPQFSGQYDGFNYLGAGIVICLVATLLMNIVIHKFRVLMFANLRAHQLLLLLFAILLLFALSNTITLGRDVVAMYPISVWTTDLLGIFRASARMFWPIYYMIFLTAIVAVLRLVPSRYHSVAVGLVLSIQLIDLTPGLGLKVDYFSKMKDLDSAISKDSTKQWDRLTEGKSEVVFLNQPPHLPYELAARIGSYKLRTNVSIAARGNDDDIYSQAYRKFLATPLRKHTIYLTSDSEMTRNLANINRDNPNIMTGRLEPMFKDRTETAYSINDFADWSYISN